MATESTEKHGKEPRLKAEELIYKIRACVYEVYRELGHGFLEKVYERALTKELKRQGLKCATQVAMEISYQR